MTDEKPESSKEDGSGSEEQTEIPPDEKWLVSIHTL